MFERLKRWGEIAAATTAIWALLLGFTAFVGGHLPPYLSFADGQDLKSTQQQLAVIVLSDKVAQIEGALQVHPEDQNLRASLLYWRQQLTIAQAITLPHR